MRLLVIAYEMDEKAVTLAWQARVVRELARHCEQVVVLAERVGPHTVPPNVIVQPFARPRIRRIGMGRLAMLWQTWRLCREQRISAVFIHMAHRHAYRLWPVFAALRLPVLLWYAHGTVTWHLRLAHASVDRVISSTPEGFRLPSRKVHFIGQGVDAELFALRPAPVDQPELLAVARLSRRKRIELLLDVMEHLKGDGFQLRVVGAPLGHGDRSYEAELRDRITRKRLAVELVGSVPLEVVPRFYRSASLHLNVSETGSMDKDVIEALSCGCPVLTSNPAHRALLTGHPDFIIRDERPEAIAAQVRALYARRADFPPASLRALVVGRHDLCSYAGRIMEQLNALAGR